MVRRLPTCNHKRPNSENDDCGRHVASPILQHRSLRKPNSVHPSFPPDDADPKCARTLYTSMWYPLRLENYMRNNGAGIRKSPAAALRTLHLLTYFL
jgi:hypothetical protein